MLVNSHLQNGILKLQLNRPDKRNAFDAEMIRQITTIFKKSVSQEVKMVLLSGEGPSFSAGADLDYMKSMKNFTKAANLKDAQQLFDMFLSVYNCPVPLIGRVQGHAMGGALGLISCCDIVGATTDAQFAFSEVRLGLIPAVISPFASMKLSHNFLLQVMLTGDRFSSETALREGLVHFVGSEIELDRYLSTQTELLGSAGPQALRKTKKLLRHLDKFRRPDIHRSLTTKLIADQRRSVEGQEGLTSFFEKRQPNWTPQ